ncbi:YcbJ family phosphotransferase [Erwinia sp. MMLR14_017]|uniref:YcbJ family phosphotransferase n=1 Tax=Erwinia sp. MMLR14_017 TaxID=3093842 RepID=UPI0029906E66|nr:YcbJ family phosphotransferase [Erwinia sp. MMLR14_017]MDW8846541.1 YcbJ family phosphotransferase [Erwinia sp. MMLR14_017]
MEHLRSELSLILGEPLSRLECISEQPWANLYSLYDQQGYSLPLVAKYFNIKGVAAQEAYKLSMLARESALRMPAVYGLIVSQQQPQHEVLLIERMGGVSVEAPSRTPGRWLQLQDQIVEALLAWHRIDSHGLVGRVDSTQENNWVAWYAQRVEVLWSTLGFMRTEELTMENRRVLYRSRENLGNLLADFNDSCVLVHGNLSLSSMLKEAWSDQLLSMINPGMMLWAPREYELFRLCDEGLAESLLFHYLRQAPVAEGFVARRWLYRLWDEIDRLIHTGQFDKMRFQQAANSLLPWLA